MRVVLPDLKWNKKLDSIDFSNLGQWMEDCERSLLPDDTVFPREGQVWETVRECKVPFRALISWSRPPVSKAMLSKGVIVPSWWTVGAPPFLPFGTARLQKGERLRVKAEPEFPRFAGPRSIRALLVPLRYDELQESIVPKEIRTLPQYNGFRLCVRTARQKWCVAEEKEAYLNEDFRLIEDVG